MDTRLGRDLRFQPDLADLAKAEFFVRFISSIDDIDRETDGEGGVIVRIVFGEANRARITLPSGPARGLVCRVADAGPDELRVAGARRSLRGPSPEARN